MAWLRYFPRRRVRTLLNEETHIAAQQVSSTVILIGLEVDSWKKRQIINILLQRNLVLIYRNQFHIKHKTCSRVLYTWTRQIDKNKNHLSYTEGRHRQDRLFYSLFWAPNGDIESTQVCPAPVQSNPSPPICPWLPYNRLIHCSTYSTYTGWFQWCIASTFKQAIPNPTGELTAQYTHLTPCPNSLT